MIPDLANAGVTHVWLPPPSQSAAPQGKYFPVTFLGKTHGFLFNHNFPECSISWDQTVLSYGV